MSNRVIHDNWQSKKIRQAIKHQFKAFDEINELTICERKGRLITLDNGTRLTEFISCSYLGLDHDPRVVEAATDSIYKCGVTFPCARTRISVSSFLVLDELLQNIFCNSPNAVFAALHLGTLGLLPVLGSGEMPSFPMKINGPCFILDKKVHASIQINRALLQQFGRVVLVDFQQQDLIEKEFKLAFSNKQTPVSISDSIGSMGGVAPVKHIISLCEKYDGYTYLDDAHGTSVYGRFGCGYVLEQLDHHFHPRLILASSLAKAFGAVGGVISLPTKEDEQMIKRFSNTYIFGGPPPLSIIDSAIAAAKIHLTDEIYVLQDKLRNNIIHFDQNIKGRIVNINTTAPIRGVFIGNEFQAITATLKLREAGFAVTAAMYPTVAKNQAILRVALSAAHNALDILALCKMINQVQNEILAV